MIIRSMTSSLGLASRSFLLGTLMIGMHMVSQPADSAAAQVPWECSNYSDEAQTRCLNAFIERQQEQIGQLEGRLQSQQEALGQLRGQIDRQSAAVAQLQQPPLQPPVATGVVPAPYLYPYGYAYPPVGFGLYLGRPWIGPRIYGYYGGPYWGPRFYRHYGRHW
ncbi:MAG TPA: hypothetical protein VL261_06080 [Nitrospira sp.]|nr:hypothetical protein [Nitrospira sp.]